jgi:hypothetical protein
MNRTETLPLLLLLLLCRAGLAGQQQPEVPAHRLADSMQRKLGHIQENAQRPQPDQTPTVISEEEINAYLAAGRVSLPKGLKKVVLEGSSGVVTALLSVDFDEIRAGQNSANPWLSVFSGLHNVRIETDAAGNGGEGRVGVRSIAIDGTEVPRMALEYFVDEYLKPKYPNVGLDSQFPMPTRIDIAIVGYHTLTVTQR